MVTKNLLNELVHTFCSTSSKDLDIIVTQMTGLVRMLPCPFKLEGGLLVYKYMKNIRVRVTDQSWWETMNYHLHHPGSPWNGSPSTGLEFAIVLPYRRKVLLGLEATWIRRKSYLILRGGHGELPMYVLTNSECWNHHNDFGARTYAEELTGTRIDCNR